MQIKSYVSDNVRNQELLRLDIISPMWAKRLEESKLLPLLSFRRFRLYFELKHTSKCVLKKHMAFPHLMYLIVNGVLRLLGKFMIYFMICSYSKLEATKKEFVKHWS